MPVVTFYTHYKEQTGNTVSAIALATYLGITHNKKILLMSTSYKDSTIKESFWTPEERKNQNIVGSGANTQAISQSGIEDLDRIVRSNRISPDIITNYTKVVLRGRLEVLESFKGEAELYNQLQNNYAKIVALAGKYYDTVIVDIDKGLTPQNKLDILNASDIVLAMATQKPNSVVKIKRMIDEQKVFKKENTLITLGKYDNNTKYNAKNISRNILRQGKIINTIPYNSQLFEAIQEGTVIDVLWKLKGLINMDENYLIIKELQRLSETIDSKNTELQMRR